MFRLVRRLLHNRSMAKKLLIARLGAGSITMALCAALPGCNLAIHPNDCVGQPSSRGMSSVECPDAQTDMTGAADDAARDATPDTADDSAQPGENR
jgi:hypothetical protein